MAVSVSKEEKYISQEILDKETIDNDMKNIKMTKVKVPSTKHFLNQQLKLLQ